MENTMERFVHRFVPAEADTAEPQQKGNGHAERLTSTSRPHPLLLLHGTGGDENQLIALGRELAPNAALLSPKGQVDEGGHARFFRRVAEGVFDLEDLIARTHELATFIAGAKKAYNLNDARFVAVGFSNGANIAGSLLLLYPELFAGAVLYRPMVPFVPESLPNLKGTSILIVPGERDTLVPQEETERLIQLLQRTNATIKTAWQPGGHRMTDNDLTIAREWLHQLSQ